MIIDKKLITSLIALFAISGCVTQTFENDKSTPVVENESTNNDIAMTRISLGLGYLKMGNTAQAKLNLEKAKRFSPKLVQVHTAFAHYFDTVGEPEKATLSFETALSLKPEDADTLNNYGVFLCKQGKLAEAEKHILKAIAQPSYILVSQSYENLALCQLKAKQFSKAENYFAKAILHSPSSASSLLQMMQLQYAKGDYQNARTYLSRYEKATRRFTPGALALAYKIFEQQKNVKMAKNYAAMLVKMFPHSYEAKMFLLNGLKEIEADLLAQQYQRFKDSHQKSKKRVVVLSPSKSTVPLEKPKKVAEQITASKGMQENAKAKDKPTTKINQENVETPFHRVQKGDNLFLISTQYNIQMKALRKWNQLSKQHLLKIGDVIYLANPNEIAKPKEQ